MLRVSSSITEARRITRDVDCRRGEVEENARDVRYRRGNVGKKKNAGYVMSDVVEMKSGVRMASGVAKAKMRRKKMMRDFGYC